MPFYKTSIANRESLIGGKTPNKRSTINYKPAFTLIEVLLSVFFLIAMVTILLSASGTLLHTRKSNLETIAAKIATKQIENLRNTDFDSLPASGTFSDTELTQLPAGVATRTFEDTTIDSQIEPDIQTVTITITWTESGVPKQFETQTLIYRYGL